MFRNKDGAFSAPKLIVFIVVVIAVLVIAAESFVVIPAGHTGVVVTMGSVSENVLQEGFHTKAPFVQQIVQIDNRIVKLEVTTEAFSKDLQTVSTVIAVNYRILKSMSYSIYKEVGGDFESVLVTPAVNEVLKAVVSEYTASDLVASRGAVSVKLDEALNTKLYDRGIMIEDINIINWDFSEEYIQAIEDKQVAEQNLIRTQTEQEQAIVIAQADAKKIVIAAEADAESVKIAAEAEAERMRIEADAVAEANETIAASLAEGVLDYRTIEKWDGALPKATIGSDASALIDIGLE